MEKVIYEGPALGFYTYSRFREFMQEKNAIHVNHNFDLTNNIFQIWEFGGVTIDYRHNGSVFDGGGIALVRLKGEDAVRINGIEQIILADPDRNHGSEIEKRD